MRHRFARNLLGEILTANRMIKIALLIPFIVLLFDVEIFYYSWTNQEKTILIASGFVLFLSILEIIAVIKEIHEHITKVRRLEILERRLEKIAKEIKNPTVRKIVDKFMAKYPKEYTINEVYHAACILMDNLKNK